MMRQDHSFQLKAVSPTSLSAMISYAIHWRKVAWMYGVLFVRHGLGGKNEGCGRRLLQLALTAALSWPTAHTAQAQLRTPPAATEFAMDELAIDNDAETLGKHVARLHHAARVCGGGFDEKRVDPFGESSERLRNTRAYTDAYNSEARHLPGYQRFRGLEPTCQRLYAFYGPRGSCARYAYNPLRDQFGNRSRPQLWLRRLPRRAGN